MTVVIAHGQPKSGSTFLYMTAMEIAQNVNSEEFYTYKNRVLGEDFPTFVDEITADFVLDLDNRIPRHQMFIIKTHGELSEDLAAIIARGQVKAFTSFRDLRDTALSTLDVAVKDREIGDARYFAKYNEIEQLRNAIPWQWNAVSPWVRCPGVFANPYYMTALSQSTCVGLLARYLGAGYMSNTLAAEMDAKRTSLPEYNKGVLDRFVSELSPNAIQFANETWAAEIAEYNALLETKMAELGHAMACHYYMRMRDAKITERLAEAA